MELENETPAEKMGGVSYVPIIVTVLALIALGVFYALEQPLAFQISSVVVISIVIWQACDPFADAAQYIGTMLRLPGSVRGATLDAIASSMPELFTGVFFVLLAVAVYDDVTPAAATTVAGAAAAAEENVAHKTALAEEGFGATLATCAGSAIYNMILIPAFCGIFIALYRPARPTIDIEPEVISRDGMWFIGCEITLLICLYQNEMYWWMGLIFLAIYVGYVLHLYRDARRHRAAHDAVASHLRNLDEETPQEKIVEALRTEGFKASPELIEAVRKFEDDEEEESSAGVLFGFFDIPLNMATAWLVIVVCTAVAAGACYFLVEATRSTAEVLDVPVFFVAVILAAAASSVPDTFLSVGAAMRGDDSGAVSNAFGSNIFDICICLSVPLFINSYLNGWGPVALTSGDEPISGLVDLRVLLCVLTIITLIIMWHKHQLTFTKSLVLCLLYAVFLGYAIAGSLGYTVF